MKDIRFTYFANGHDPCQLLHVQLISIGEGSILHNVISIFERESIAKNNSGVEKLHVQVKLAKLCPLSSTKPLLLLKTKYVKGLQMLKEDLRSRHYIM